VRYLLATTAIAATAVLTACSASDDVSAGADDSAQAPTTVQPAAAVEASPEEQLLGAAQELELGVIGGDAATAWKHYSQRCRNVIGDLDAYESLMEIYYQGRDPKPTDWIVKVVGSSGQVVTVDSDPNAPASALNPRTWTYIDGRWQFDNC